jgi:hypothetical protein
MKDITQSENVAKPKMINSPAMMLAFASPDFDINGAYKNPTIKYTSFILLFPGFYVRSRYVLGK